MWNTILNWCVIWSMCCLHLVCTGFVSDKALRVNTGCENENDCGQNAFCDDNYCKCWDGYVNHYNGSCVSCDDFNKVTNDCIEVCCPGYCSNNICHSSNPPNGDILLTATQIAMTGALILGILTIIALLWKMCSKTDYRRRVGSSTRRVGRSVPRHLSASRRSGDSSTSVGSLQRDVSERLRDAPPPYIRGPSLPSPGDMPPPYHVSQGYTNASFVGETNMPPPDYSVIIRLSGNDTTEQNGANETRTQEVKTEIPKQQACKETDSSKSVGDVLEGSSGHI